MMCLGDAFRVNAPDYHRYVVISDPQENGGFVVFVKLTSADGSWDADDECIITPQEWPDLKRNTVVEFSTCYCKKDSVDLANAFVRLTLDRIKPPPIEVLRKILDAAKKSKQLRDKASRENLFRGEI